MNDIVAAELRGTSECGMDKTLLNSPLSNAGLYGSFL